MCHQLSQVLHTHCRNKSDYLLAIMFVELYLPIIQHANGFQQLWFVHIWLFYVTLGKPNLNPQIACKPWVVQMSLSNSMTSEPKPCLFLNTVFWGLKEYYCKNWTKKICNLICLKNESINVELLPSLIEVGCIYELHLCFLLCGSLAKLHHRFQLILFKCWFYSGCCI